MLEGKDLTVEIGRRLRAERHRCSLSLSALSDRTDGVLSKSRISNYEQGIRRMGLEEAEILGRSLGDVSPIYLLCLDDSDPLTADEHTLVTNYRLADERGRATVMAVSQAQIDASLESRTMVA